MDVDNAITAHALLHTSLLTAIEAQQLLDGAIVQQHHLELRKLCITTSAKLPPKTLSVDETNEPRHHRI